MTNEHFVPGQIISLTREADCFDIDAQRYVKLPPGQYKVVDLPTEVSRIEEDQSTGKRKKVPEAYFLALEKEGKVVNVRLTRDFLDAIESEKRWSQMSWRERGRCDGKAWAEYNPDEVCEFLCDVTFTGLARQVIDGTVYVRDGDKDFDRMEYAQGLREGVREVGDKEIAGKVVKRGVYRPRFIGHSVAHIQAAFSTGLQAILLAWAGVR